MLFCKECFNIESDILGCVHMFTKLHNFILCAVFPLDKMMGEVVENANNFRLILPKPKFACGGFWSMITIYMYQ